MKRLTQWFPCFVGSFILAGALTVSEAAWCGNSFMYIGPTPGRATWYTGSNSFVQAGEYFDGANLGVDLTTLPLGGELQVWMVNDGQSTDGVQVSAQMGYMISGPVSVTNAQYMTMDMVGMEGNNAKMQIKTAVDLIDVHNLPAGTYSVSIWFWAHVANSTVVGDSNPNGQHWDSNNSSNFVATFTVGEFPRIQADGPLTAVIPDVGSGVFEIPFSLEYATAAGWSAVMKSSLNETITNWNAAGSTGTFTWATETEGNWTLMVSAYEDAERTKPITSRMFALSANHDMEGLGQPYHMPTMQLPWGDTMCLPLAPKPEWDIWLSLVNPNNVGTAQTVKAWYRFGETGGWASTNLTDTLEPAYTNIGFSLWRAMVPSPAGIGGEYMEYYFEADYGTGGPQTTYVGRSANSALESMIYKTPVRAQASPFLLRFVGDDGTEPGFIWHGGNITRVSDQAVQVWVKIGYEDGALRWADDVKLEYTLVDDAAITGRKSGVLRRSKAVRAAKALASPTVVAMRYSHSEADPGGNGNAMWWMATIEEPGLSSDTAVLKYEIYARKKEESGGTGKWLQAEYTYTSLIGSTFEYRMYSDGSGDLKVNGVNADYTTSKFFIDEADPSDVVTFHITYAAPDDAEDVELFTNLGRRDFADVDSNGDGWPDGLVPPDGNWVTAANSVDAYWQAIPMGKGSGAYEATLTITNCGAYRITARYKANGADDWTWYSDGPDGIKRRDHAVVISPKKALTQTMYELNALTTKATSLEENDRGTFEGLSETNGTAGAFGEFSLEYLNNIGANCLWFQPIHPSGDSRVEDDPEWGDRYYPGSPYATKNYFAVNKYMSATKTEAGALAAFTNFVRLCDRAQGGNMESTARKLETVNVMLDGVMNHTSWDAIYGAGLALATNGLGANALAELSQYNLSTIPSTERIATAGKMGINWYSWKEDYSKPATEYTDAWNNNVATAPERVDFGKWDDVAELFYGNYSTMVRWDDRQAPDYELTEETSRMYNEDDQYYYGEMRPETKLLWKYMAAYPEYWLKQTGHAGYNQPGVMDTDGVLFDDYGIDGLRCDYAQGLPSQFWEYLINRTRSMKWNFLFMAESLDGGKVGYRSNRHFDILNENIVFRFTQDKVSDPYAFQAAFEDRRAAYGEGVILLNLTSHDEVIPFDDPWATLSRYGMVSALDGVPMIFYGQEQSISRYYEGEEINKWKGFHRFEKNFGKMVPHFKKWNQMYVWGDPAYPDGDRSDSRAMAALYGRINHARLNSPALQSKHRWFLNDTNRIMAVAKWETPGENPNVQDAVFAAVLFVNEGDGGPGTACTYDISPFAASMGIENSTGRYYNVRNLVSSEPEMHLWDDIGKTGAEIYLDGIYVGFAGATNEVNAWQDGAVVQYLKIVDTTPYGLPQFEPVAPTGYVNTVVSFPVTATGDGNPQVTIAEVTPQVDWTFEGGFVSFIPASTGSYVFACTAMNQYNGLAISTNITVTVVEQGDSPDPVITVDTVTFGSINISGGTFELKASSKDLPASIEEIPVWTASEIISNAWDWELTHTGRVVTTDEGRIIEVELPVEDRKLISVGKPLYLRDDENP